MDKLTEKAVDKIVRRLCEWAYDQLPIEYPRAILADYRRVVLLEAREKVLDEAEHLGDIEAIFDELQELTDVSVDFPPTR